MLEGCPRVRVNRMGITPCAPDWCWDTAGSTWRDCDVWVILRGRGRLESPEGGYDMLPGDCFWFRAGQRYVTRNATRRPIVISYNHFDVLDARGRVVRPPAAELPPLHRRMTDVDLVRSILERAVALRQEEPPRWPEINAWFGALLAEILRQDRQLGYSGLELEQLESIESLCAEVRARPERFGSVRAMAAAMGYTPQHFARVFRKFRGEGPKSFVIRTRVERAKALLASSHSVGRISDLLGYSDVYFFSKQFKRVTGQSPSAWRKAQL
jgi:AraC-like DNA-binding protein